MRLRSMLIEFPGQDGEDVVVVDVVDVVVVVDIYIMVKCMSITFFLIFFSPPNPLPPFIGKVILAGYGLVMMMMMTMIMTTLIIR